MPQYSVLSLFVKKLNTDKENKRGSVQLQGNFDAALECVHLVRRYISFFPNSTILGLAANTRSKRERTDVC